MPCFSAGRWVAGFSLVACLGLTLLFAPALSTSAVSASQQEEEEARNALPGKPRTGAARSGKASVISLAAQPLRFEQNQGQTDSRVDYLARGRRYALFLSGGGAVLWLRGGAGRPDSVVEMRLVEANSHPAVQGVDEFAGKSHYLTGNDPAAWRPGVPNFGKVRYRQVYAGVDLVYYGRGGELEYDFVVAPGSDPATIALRFDGADSIALEQTGDLSIALPGGVLRQHKPFLYQEKNGVRTEVPGGYTLLAGNRVGFEVGAYDRGLPLVIDPILSYSTFLGGGSDDISNAIAVDAAGNAYVTGLTKSSDFPKTSGVLQENHRGGEDVFVTKFNAAGTDIIFSTFLGGGGDDIGNGIAVDASGFVYVAGITESDNFPVTDNATQRSFQRGGSDCFVTKLTPNGAAAVFSTYLGANNEDRCSAIAVDAAGNAHVVGVTRSDEFPISAGVFRPERDGGEEGFVTKYNAPGDAVLFSIVLGGGGGDGAEALALDAAGNIYVTGYTGSDRFPVTPDALQNQRRSGDDAFVSKLSPDGSSLLYSTFLGGNNDDSGRGIALDAEGSIYVAGITDSTNFPTSSGAYQRFLFTILTDAFVTKLDAAGRGVYSTYIGGEGGDSANGIVVDSQGLASIAGVTRSIFFPIVSGQDFFGGGTSDAYISQFNADGSNLLDSTYLGGGGDDEAKGIAIDPQGRPFLTGFTRSNDFPVSDDAYQDSRSNSAAFVTKVAVSTFTAVSAAAPGLPALGIAPGSLASGFGAGWTTNASAPPGLPLPSQLGRVQVFLVDSADFVFTLPLLAVVTNPSQINFLVPAGAAPGLALLEVEENGFVISRGVVEIANVAPGIFTANANGEGVPAATALRFRGDGSVSEEFVFSNAPLGSREPLPINLGPESDRVFLILYGTGIRNATTVTATAGGVPITGDIFFGAQPQFEGLDQVNVPLPRALIGRGVVDVSLTVDGVVSNVVRINVQ